MSFTVRGAIAATGQEVRLIIDAESPEAAAAAANAQGIYVASVAKSESPRRAPKHWPLSRRLTLWLAAIVLLIPIVIVWQLNKDRLIPSDSSSEAHPVLPGQPTPTSAVPARSTDSWISPSPVSARSTLSGTFASEAGAEAELSITFDASGYRLNPSSKFRWAAGTIGTWELQEEHPSLNRSQRAEGWCILTMTPPDNPSMKVPATVKLLTDSQGQVTAIHFASFMGVDFPPAQQMTLTRHPAPLATPPAAAVSTARRPAASANMATSLGRAGYEPAACLICRDRRSAMARTRFSDLRGFGLCDRCGNGYRGWLRVLAGIEAGVRPTLLDQALSDEFQRTMRVHFGREDSDGRRGIGLFFLTAKFATPEWDTLTGGE